MDATEQYFNLVRNYNEKLRNNNTDWLEPEDLGEVLLQTARQNMERERNEP